MIYSSACEYAIRAMAYLVGSEAGTRVLAREVAEAETIPGPFLGKVFQTLVKGGLLHSTKGPGGGFSLAKNPKDITLLDIYTVVDGINDLERCAAGLAECSDEQQCPLHESWKPIRAKIRRYLETTTLAQMAAATRKKRELLEKPDS
jgi:Rrf2 family protein